MQRYRQQCINTGRQVRIRIGQQLGEHWYVVEFATKLQGLDCRIDRKRILKRGNRGREGGMWLARTCADWQILAATPAQRALVSRATHATQGTAPRHDGVIKTT
jgi:hypothetical protein